MIHFIEILKAKKQIKGNLCHDGHFIACGTSTESNFDKKGFKDKAFEMLYNRWKNWKRDYPEEEGLADPSYMHAEYTRFLQPLPFIMSAKVAYGASSCKAVEIRSKACYYNALDNSLRTGIGLGFGIIVAKEDMKTFLNHSDKEKLMPLSYTTHAFNVDKSGKIIDPTLGKNDDLYFYKKISKKQLSKFKHKFRDEGYDARDFANYVYDTGIDKYTELEFSKEFKNYIKKR